MPRRRRYGMGGFVFHVLNRGARRGGLFETGGDYDAFERVLREALERRPIRLLNYCVMRNHFHFLMWPETDKDLPEFMHRFTLKQALRWRTANNTLGEGAVYQGRYKAIPVHTDEHFLSVARYVERNPLRAGLVERAEDWRWSSLWHREVKKDNFPLAKWPVACPADWLHHVNQAQTAAELSAIRKSVKRGCALGNRSWQEEVAKTLGVPGFYRPQGRPPRNRS
jgi:putative transposase